MPITDDVIKVNWKRFYEDMKEERDQLKSEVESLTGLWKDAESAWLCVLRTVLPTGVERDKLRKEVETLKAENANYITAINNMHTPEEVETLKKEWRQSDIRYNIASDKLLVLQDRIDRVIPYIEAHDCCFDTMYRILRGEE